MATYFKSGLKIIFWNARSILKRKEELKKILRNIDIFICVESWLDENIHNFDYSGFKTFRVDRTYSKGGGILMFIKNNIPYKQINNIKSPHQTVELAGVEIQTNPIFNIYACYRAPGNRKNNNPKNVITLEQWETIFSNFNNEHNNLIVGDFNAHNVLWNCDKTDSNGENLYECIDQNNLFIHNTDSYSHVDSTSNSNIDLIISSGHFSDKIETIVHDDTWGSDHLPIYINVNSEKSYYKKKTFKLRSKKTNWQNFSLDLENGYNYFLTSEYDNLSTVEKYDRFVKIVSDAVIENTPKKSSVDPKSYKNPAGWWDNECDSVKKSRNEAFKAWAKSKLLVDFIEYKRLKAIALRTFKIKKKNYFVKFSEKINLHTDSRYVWNTCKILKNKWIQINPSHVSENLQRDGKITAFNKICPSWVENNPNYFPNCKTNELLASPFDFTEFNIALASRNPKSSPGLDGIDFLTLQNLPIKYKLILLDIYNDMYKLSEFPESWKHSYVHFICKPDGKSYRPIALTPSPCKLFETMIKNKFQWWVEKENILPVNQSGFRKGQSCSDNVLKLFLDVDDALKKKKHMYATFLDVEGAYDNVNSDLLIEKLAKIGCPLQLVQFVKFLTYERFVYNGDVNEHRTAYKGVPQGGVLSPILYLIYVADILKNLPKTVYISQFADDICIYSKNLNSLQKALTVANNDLGNIGLSLSAPKTVLIDFNNLSTPPGEASVTIGNHTITSSATARFLGVIFDYQLSFVPHINKIHSRCQKSLNIVKFLQGIWWGADPNTLITFYKSYVRSVLDFCSFVYFPTRKDLKEKLERIQFTAIRSSLGLRKTTPLAILLAESKLPTIYERSKFLCCSYLTKILTNESLPIHKTIIAFEKKNKKDKRKRKKLISLCVEKVSSFIPLLYTTNKYTLYSYNYETVISTIRTNSSLGMRLKKVNSPNTFFQNLKFNQANLIYTDASKSDQSPSVGTACILPSKNITINHSLDKSCSIFTAECTAIKDAVDIALQHSDSRNIIFTDSLSAVQCLNSSSISIKTNPLIFEIKQKYQEFMNIKTDNGSIEIFWIPSHCGITGNELADASAKNASNSPPLNPSKIPFTDLRETFKKEMIINTRSFVKDLSITTGIKYFENYYRESSKPWFHNKQLPRDVIVTINRCRADHYNLAASLARVKIVTSPNCPCSHSSQDIDHIVWQCPLYNDQRLKLMQDLINLKLNFPLNMGILLTEPNVTACASIVTFLKKCDLKI